MRFGDYYRQGSAAISFELFPPKTEKGLQRLRERLPRLLALGPDFVTVTYGALGSTQEQTLEIARTLRRDHAWETAHHLTCVGSDRARIDRILDRIEEAGIENIVALRGDPPAGSRRFEPPPGGFRHACELVEHIRARGNFGVAVAGYPETHPEASDSATDLRHLAGKVACGADVIITQLFYDNRHFFGFERRCREAGIECPIVPGLLPILSVSQIRRITSLCGSSLPDSLLARLEAAGDDQARVRQIGIEHTVRQAGELLERGVAGIHFYVLNRCFHVQEIMQRLELRPRGRPSVTAGNSG